MNSGKAYQLLEAAVKAHGAGQTAEAQSLYNQVLAEEPGNLEALKRLSVLLLQTGQASTAYETIKKAIQINPRSRSVMEIFGAAAIAVGDNAMAVRVFEPLAKNPPPNPLYFEELSKAHYGLNNYRKSIDAFGEFLKHTPAPRPEHYFTMGRLYFRNRQPLEAANWLDKALAAGFENSEILAIRANCYIHGGDKQKAVELFEKSIVLDPDNIEAHYQHRNLIKTEAGDPIFQHLEGLKNNPEINGTVEINLYFLLGKLYQRQGEDEKAFENYTSANAKTRKLYAAQGFAYDANAIRHEFDLLKKTFCRSALSGLPYKGSASETPVFIVGMPRSGTTLLEQIITAHPRAEGRGELDQMHYIHTELEAGLKRAVPRATLLAENGEKWQKSYLDALAPGAGTLRVTDKLPANARSLGLISVLFPKARVIHIRRNPMDVGFSIFANLFDTGHPYSADLKSIGDYTRQTLDLLDTWKQELDLPILTIDYEDLVADQEKYSKEIIEFLGLEWDPACLDFHKQDTAAMTLSSIQVREPLSAKSVDRWKRFEKHLGPLKAGLGDALRGGQ